MLTDTKNKKVGTYGIKLATLRSQLLHFVGNGINIFTYTGGKIFKAYISETTANWMKRQNRCLIMFLSTFH
jgi:hypothetical protein